MPRTRQNADEPEPEPTFNMEQMTDFLQSLQQAAGGSNEQSIVASWLRTSTNSIYLPLIGSPIQ